MERKYLYSYLHYQKQNNLNSWKRLIRLPWYILTLLAISITLLFFTLFFEIFLDNKLPVAITEIVTLIIIFITYFLSENYKVSASKSTLDDYAKTRDSINEWLKTVHITNDDDKQLLLARLKEYISLQETNQKRTADRWDKWLQVLVIPTVLAIITTVISKQQDANHIIISVMTIAFLFGMVYGVFVLFRTIYGLPQRRLIAQMQCFADDVQSTMDMEQLGWIKNISDSTRD